MVHCDERMGFTNARPLAFRHCFLVFNHRQTHNTKKPPCKKILKSSHNMQQG